MGGEKAEAPNHTMISFSSALEIAKEFFVKDGRPTCIEWFDL